VKCGRAIREKNHVSRQEADDFLDLLNSDWADLIGTIASTSAAEDKYNQPAASAATSERRREAQGLHACVKSSHRVLLVTVSDNVSVSLCRLIAVNNRRPEEPAKLIIK